MATFTNQAVLTYGGRAVPSNLVQGELTGVLSAAKSAVQSVYTPGARIPYTVSLRNAGTTPLTGVSITDNLGAYPITGGTAIPLTYEDGSVQVYANGVLQPAPTVTRGTGVTFSDITVPAGGNVLVVYTAIANTFADPRQGGTVTNTVSATGAGIVTPVTAQADITADTAPELTIQKSVSPNPVVENETLTFTFLVQNTGAQPADAATGAVITDTFNPPLSNITVTYNGTPLAAGTGYTYNPATGAFSTALGVVTVPAADFAQDAATGEWTVTPGTGTLIVSGTV